MFCLWQYRNKNAVLIFVKGKGQTTSKFSVLSLNKGYQTSRWEAGVQISPAPLYPSGNLSKTRRWVTKSKSKCAGACLPHILSVHCTVSFPPSTVPCLWRAGTFRITWKLWQNCSLMNFGDQLEEKAHRAVKVALSSSVSVRFSLQTGWTRLASFSGSARLDLNSPYSQQTGICLHITIVLTLPELCPSPIFPWMF